MIESVAVVDVEAKRFIDHYLSWRDGDMDRTLSPKDGSSPNHLDVRLVIEKAADLARGARRLLENEDAAQIEESRRRDLLRIAEEMQSAVDDASEHVNPDAVFAKLDHATKLKLLQRAPFVQTKATELRAKLRGDARVAKERATAAGTPPGKNK